MSEGRLVDIVIAEPPSSLAYCQQAKGLLEALAGAIHKLILIHDQQFQAVIEGDPDTSHFDDRIHMANQLKNDAKYAYLQHQSEHGCSTFDGGRRQTSDDPPFGLEVDRDELHGLRRRN